MIYVALVEAVALVALTLVFAGLVQSLIRQQARERSLLLAQLMHLAGRTWETPPAQAEAPVPPVEFPEYETGVLPNY